MRRNLGFNGRFGGRRVGLLGTLALVAGLAAGPRILAARSSTPVGTVGPGSNSDTSPDGHWTSFESAASTLVASDPNGPTVDVFVYHVDDQSLRLASVPAGGGGGDGASYSASVANNGTVSFTSVAGNMAPGGSGQQV